MASISWRDAARNDRQLLQAFTCTVDHRRDRAGRPVFHPRPWELEVQSHIRRRTPPAGPDQRLRLGIDESGAMVAASEQVRVLADGGIAIVKLQAVAVSSAERGRGGEVADRVLEDALERSIDLAELVDARRVVVVGWVDPRNQASKALLARAGFARRSDTPDGLEDWATVIDR